MTEPQGRVVLYRYGPMAWFWRVLIAGALAGGGALVGLAFTGAWAPLWVGLPLVLPAWFFGVVVATRVVCDGGHLRVATLLGWPRRVRLDRLGTPKRYRHAYGDTTRFHAPRLWQPVRGKLPIYLDCLAHIPDRRAFEQVFGALPK